MPVDRVALIRDRLTTELHPLDLQITDDSWQHAGHAGAGKGGHFSVAIVSAAFEGKRMIQRHRLVYDALGAAMQTEIHALQIDARTPAEAGK